MVYCWSMYKNQVDNQILKALESGYIKHSSGLSLIEHIQPSSVDIPLGDVGHAVRRRFSAFIHPIERIVESIGFEKYDLDDNDVILFKGQNYLFPVLDVDLPDHLQLQFSPKSSIGRIDLSVRMIADQAGVYDRTPKGYKGTIWMEVTPRSFNVKVRKGVPLTQMKIVEEENYDLDIADIPEIMIDQEVKPTFFDKQTMILGLNVPKGELVGYVAKETHEPINMSKFGEYDPMHFFTPVMAQERTYPKVELSKDRFYILRTKSKVAVPPEYSAEMLSISHHVGELRAHYAGYFDPGFGNSNGGNTGVLEVRPFDTITCYDNQPIALLRYSLNAGKCDEVYGDKGNNYAKQEDIKLAKYFKEKK